MSAEEVCALLRAHRFNFVDELELQGAIALVFDDAGVPYLREHRLSKQDRVDFLIPTDSKAIALEVKLATELTTLTRQLWRYAQHDLIASLILVTSRSRHRQLPEKINGKTLQVVALEVVF